MHTSDFIKPITSRQEWLFKRMAGRFEGWAVKGERGSRDVPLNELDLFAVRLLAMTIEKDSKTVLAVPRATPGLSLSLVSYLTVNRFISKRTTGMEALALTFEGFQAIQMDADRPVIVITKNRKLRDYYLNSDITFNGRTFSFRNFPIFRIKRSGDVVPLVTSSDNSEYKIGPVVFYHLDQIDKFPPMLEGSTVLIELDALMGYRAMSRLKEFVDSINPHGVLAVTSTFSTPTILQMKKEGYGVVALRPELALKYGGEEESFPSFCSSLANLPSLTEINLQKVDSETIEIIIHRLNEHLNQISKQLKDDLPSIFFAARTLLALLKNLAVPLEILETSRKQTGYLKSIKFLLDKVFTSRYIDLTPVQEAAILPVWGALASDFYELYNQLSKENPKYLALVAYLQEQPLQKGDVIVANDVTQSKILKDLFNAQDSNISELRVYTVKEIERLGIRATRLITTGLWQAKDEATIAGTIPEELSLICYRSEIGGIKFAIKRLQEIALSEESITTLANLGLDVASSEKKTIMPWISPSPDSELLLSEKISLNDVEEPVEELPDYYYSEPEDVIQDIQSAAEDENRSFFEITDDEGENFILDAAKEVLAYTSGSKSVKSLSPENLNEGDILLALDNESNREIFQEIATRTRELSEADASVLNEWSRVLSQIRALKNSQGEKALIDILHMLRCDKTETTMRQWFKGTTLAPQDEGDVISLLRIVNEPNPSALAKNVCREVEKLRIFHRRLGRRIHSKMSEAVRGNDTNKNDGVDVEIDEILDLTHLVTIDKIEGPTETPAVSKELLVLR